MKKHPGDAAHGRKPLDFSKLRFKSRTARSHKVDLSALGRPTAAGATFAAWLESLPGFLGASELRRTVDAVVAARRAGRPVVFAFGGHVVKTGCSPLVIDLVERGVITAIATNGSGAIHDLELAETGQTSEEVAETIRNGSFGMVTETCERMNAAAAAGAGGAGLGAALGRLLADGGAAHADLSLFAAAHRKGIPATVHVALGTDTVHMHPAADGAAIGAATMHDFRILCGVVADLGADSPGGAGGVWLNFGSAVIMPEVFLKAVSVARNLGHPLDGMHTANFDMLRHYRPTQNVLVRPVQPGCGHSITGHHELMLPLLRQAIVERL
ncbi:MAG: hypothetical protein AMXMBFR47_29630 [Planctomycetota bacterium]